MDNQIKRQNSIIEIYFRAFVKFEQNNKALFFFLAKFAYNNAKNANTSHTFFKLNCGYYLCVSYEEDLDLYSKSRTAEKLFSKLQELMCTMVNLWNNTRLNQVGGMLSVNGRIVTWLGHVMWLRKTRANLEKVCKQLFLIRWNSKQKAWWPGITRITWIERKHLDKMGITLQSLEKYGYIGSKTKSYQILRGFLLLIIFHVFSPSKQAFILPQSKSSSIDNSF